MSPDDLNALVANIIGALNESPRIDNAGEGLPADTAGTLPEIYVSVKGVDLCLTVSPL